MAKTVQKPAKKRIAIFLDGTWNTVDDNTNVWRLKALCADICPEGCRQISYYDIGVNGVIGGATGKGLGDNLKEAYKWLIDVYTLGDDIFIFGFSRGAFTARSLAGLIAKYGVLKPGAPLSIRQVYERYERENDKTLWKLCQEVEEGKVKIADCSLEERWLFKYSMPVHVKMVGVWDTVGKVGIPIGDFEGISSSTLGFFHTGLRLSIDNGYHALALDEHRAAFPPTLWTVRKPREPDAVTATTRDISSVEQRWFVGAHGNVGGGYSSDLLAQLPLRWIMSKAAQHGLSFKDTVDIDGEVNISPVADSYSEFGRGAYQFIRGRSYRDIGAPPEERDNGTHTVVNETIDASVFERWRTDKNYRPPNVRKWAEAKKVDLASLKASVRADDPTASVPD